jgi:hypothetical protein
MCRTGFKNLIICWPEQPSTVSPQHEGVALATKPNHVEDLDGRHAASGVKQDAHQYSRESAQEDQVVTETEYIGCNGQDHRGEKMTTATADSNGPDPRMRRAEIHVSKLKEKKRQKQQQQQQQQGWSFTENPSEGSTSSGYVQAVNTEYLSGAAASIRTVDLRSLAAAGPNQAQAV